MSGTRTWLWVIVASLVALALGFGVAWGVQQAKLSDARAALALSQARSAATVRQLAHTKAALDAAVAQRDEAFAAVEESSASVASTSTTTTKSPAKPAGFTGKVCGYIKTFSRKSGTTYVTMDQIQFLTGKTAAEAAAAHGDESPPPNDYYIVNDNPKLRTYPLARTVKIEMTTAPDGLDAEGYSTTLAKLTGAFDGSQPALANAKASPYWFTIANDTVVAIAEQYIP